MLKIGIFGAGHLGKIHIQQWLQVADVQVVGFYDPNDEQAELAIQQYKVPRFTDVEQLIAACDALDVVTTTIVHYDIAKKCLLAGKHLFIEKPLAHTLQEAAELVQLVKEANVKCQVGHVERYNPAFIALDNVAAKAHVHRRAQAGTVQSPGYRCICDTGPDDT